MSGSRLALGAVAAIVIGICAIVLLRGGSAYTVRAEFADANGLRANYTVREQGVAVGHVVGVSVTPRDTALATIALDPSAGPIGAGARASIHPSNLLGEKYVDVQPGDLRQPLRSGSTIPLARTYTASELDQVLNAFDPDTRRATAIFLAEQGNSLLGRGKDLAGVLQALPPTLQSTQQLVTGLAQDNLALGRLIDESDRILAVAAPQRHALGSLVNSAYGAFATLASRDRGLQQTVVEAPGTLVQLRRTLGSLEQAAPPLGQAATGLQATAPSLTHTLQALPPFLAAAKPALQAVRSTAPALTQLGVRGAPVVSALQPAAARLVGFARTLAPVSRLLDQHIAQILDVLQGWSRAIGDRDGVGHIYRIEVLLPKDIFTSLLDLNGSAPAPAPALRNRAHPIGRLASLSSNRTPAAAGTRAPAAGSPRPTENPSLPTPPQTSPPPPVRSLLNYLVGR